MLNLIRQKLFGREGESVERTTDREEMTRIAAGVILLEAAHADNDCTAEEMDHVVATLRSDFGMSDKHVAELLELAHQERGRSVDLFEFTNHINASFSKEEKKSVLEAVWRIIHSDGRLEKHEDHFVRKLTHLLRLSHKEMIAAKLKARQQIE